MGPNVWEPYQSLSQSSSPGSLLRALRRTHVWQMDATLRLHMRVFLVQALRQNIRGRRSLGALGWRAKP